MREAEYRSTAFVPYWNVPLLRAIVPRQRRCTEALKVVNATLDGLIQRCKDLVEEEDQEFVEEFVGKKDPSILHFLLASGDQVHLKLACAGSHVSVMAGIPHTSVGVAASRQRPYLFANISMHIAC